MNSLVASNWIGGRNGAASSTAIGTSAGRRANSAAAAPRTISPSAPAAAPPALLRRSSGPVPSESVSPASLTASSASPASNVKRPRASSTSTAASAPPTAASWAVSACSTGGHLSRVVGGCGLPNALSLCGHQLLAGMDEVAARIVPRKDQRRHGPHQVRPGPADPPQRARDGHAVLPKVEVAVAVELHDPAAHGGGVGGELVVVDRARIRDEQDAPALVVQPLAEVRLVRVHEEVRIEPAHRLRRVPPHEHRARLHPTDLAHAAAPALHRVAVVQEDGGGERPPGVGEAPGAGGGLPLGREELRAGDRGAR